MTSNRKRRPNRRQRRTVWHNDDTASEGEDLTAAEPSPDDLYQVLILAAEGYVRLNDS